MAARNPTRVHLVEKLEKLVETYNLGTIDVEAFFEALKALTAEMSDEERRAAREGLSSRGRKHSPAADPQLIYEFLASASLILFEDLAISASVAPSRWSFAARSANSWM